MNIKAVLFDMGNVLIEINFQKMMRSFGMEFENESQAAAFVEAWKFHDQYERGMLTTAEFLQSANKALDKNLTLDEFSRCWNDIYVGEVAGVNQLLSSLKQRLPLFLLSNTNQIHIGYCLKNFTVLDHFSHRFYSYDVKSRKPETEIFQRVVDHINVKPAEILFFDDLPKNVESARRFGMNAELAFQSSQDIILGLAKYGMTC